MNAENESYLVERKIFDIFTDETGKKYKFVIPSYQRGYRWTETQLSQLLDDLLKFKKDKENRDKIYCLQPVIVRKISETESTIDYEVVDGQQRLTSIRLILAHIQPNNVGQLYQLYYERTKSEKPSGIDAWYIVRADKTISEWFVKNSKNEKESLCDEFPALLKNRVSIIWQEMEDDSTDAALERFSKINGSKIPLSSSELVKGMILNNKNYPNGLGEQRYRAGVWDEFTRTLNEPDFSSFIGARNHRDVAPDYIVELQYEMAGNPAAHKPEIVSAYFEKSLLTEPSDASAETLFDNLLEHFRSFQDWYADPTLYNLIGYLFTQGKASVKDIEEEYKGSSREEFIKSLKKQVYEDISKYVDNMLMTPLNKAILSEDLINESILGKSLNYENNNQALQKILMVFCLLAANKEKQRYAFSPEGGWSLEHIFAQNMKFKKGDTKWLMDRTKQIDEAVSNTNDPNRKQDLEKLKNDIMNCDDTSKEEELSALCQRFIDLIELFDWDEKKCSKHCIGNLALLGKNLNSALQNPPFCEKRKKLFEKNASYPGAFPIATKNVFNKSYTTSANPYNNVNLTTWTLDDCLAYAETIREELLTLKKEVN